MKKKMLSLLAAFFMLFGTSAMAQVESTLEGDVNGDGVVDIADITAVIAIIKQNAEANPTYYWYVGSMSEADALNPTTLGNIVNGKNATTSTTGISTLNVPNDAANEAIVFVYPEIWGRPNITDNIGCGTGDTYYKDEGFDLPAGYNATAWPGDAAIKGKTLNITWSK